MDFDTAWKLKCVELALDQQLSIEGEVNLKTLFKISKNIYNEGYKNKIQKWKTIWPDEEEKEVKDEEVITIKAERKSKKEETKEEIKPELKEGYKICPLCGEEVPKGFIIHRYKSNGENCGYKW